MNAIPLVDDRAIGNVRNLRMALEACVGSTGPIRTALTICTRDFNNDIRSFEGCLAIALSHIVCGPEPQHRSYANTFRQDLSSMKGYAQETEETYLQIAIKAMEAVLSRTASHTLLEQLLRRQYQEAIDIEQTRLNELTRQDVAV